MDEVNKNRARYSGEDIKIGQDFNVFSLFRFIFPSIFTFIFIALYQTVDGIFIERYAGDIAIAAVNLYSPVLSLLCAIGIMLGTGANAIAVRMIGEGNTKKANNIVSQTMILTLIVSAVLTAFLLVFAEPMMRFLGASDINIVFLRPYYVTLCAGAAMIIIQSELGVLVIGEGKSTLTAVLIMVGGVLNCVLDYVFMGPLSLGIRGAAIATVIGYASTVIYGAWFYAPKRAGRITKLKSVYKITPTKLNFSELRTVCSNGASDLVSNLAGGITAFFMNHLMMRLRGELGVSALSVVLYFQFFIVAIYMGFSMAVEPIFSYHNGTGDTKMRKKIFRISNVLLAAVSVVLTVGMWVFRRQIVGLFFTEGTEIYDMTLTGLRIAIPACLFAGFNTFASSLFTAFGNGLISAVLSLSRTLVLLTGVLFALSLIFGETGLWSSWTVTEMISLVVSAVFVFIYRKKYEY